MFLIAATFKSHKTQTEVQEWFAAVAPVAAASQAEVVVAPSFVHLSVGKQFKQEQGANISLAAQDVSPFPPGSYTGAVNASQLQDLDVSYCIIGHSERRRYFHETPAEIANKAAELLAVGITPILCISEDDLAPQFACLPPDLYPQVIFCFEPPSDIGGTETAASEDIKRVVSLVRTHTGVGRVMYGGSVNAGNLAQLLGIDLDGVLVSSASLDSVKFIELLSAYHSNQE